MKPITPQYIGIVVLMAVLSAIIGYYVQKQLSLIDKKNENA